MNTIAALEQGALVLTVNQRSAMFQRHRYNLRQREQGRQCWTTPQVYFIAQWLGQTYRDGWRRSAETVLNAFQTQALWEEIIDQSRHSNGLLNIASTARTAMQAWRLLRQWEVSVDRLASYTQPDVAAFHEWARTFGARCKRAGWLDETQLAERVATLLEEDGPALPAQVLWLGFDELTPVQQRLIDVMRRCGCDVSQVASSSRNRRLFRLPCTDAAQEWRSAALWAKTRLEASPDVRVAVIVHELSSVRDRVARIFDEVLTPAATAGQARPAMRSYNLSLGHALAETPLGATALELLALMDGEADVARLGRLLVSPFLAAAQTEYTVRAQLDVALRRRGEGRLSLQRLQALAAGACPQLAGRLKRLAQMLPAPGARRRPGEWAMVMEQWLSVWGWPGEREVDSEEYQVIEAWRESMGRFEGLDTVMGECALARALVLLRQMAHDQVFQARSADTRLHIMGTLEAAGLEFDHLWVAGWHDEAWPAPPQPNPFLPIELQRRLAMPHASADRELGFARRLTDRIIHAASDVVISYPCRDGDRDMRPSPLLGRVPECASADLALPDMPLYRDVIFYSDTGEKYSDWQAPSVAAGSRVSGGSGVFRDQAACPFRAFARYRLGAQSVPPLEVGLSAAGRGVLVHRVLELIWRQLADSQALNGMDDPALQRLVARCVDRVVADETARSPQLFTEKFSQLERWRLSAMAMAWLSMERQRPGFAVVGTEVNASVELGGLMFEIKADRVDRLAGGGLMIIDYKTGKPTVADWFGARPEQPQLPLYGVTQSDHVIAVAFGRVTRQGGKFYGLGEGNALPDGVDDFSSGKYALGNADWAACKHEWRTVLERLAGDFRQGVAVVDPKEGGATCQHCDVGPLCRINELNGLGLEAGTDD